MAKKRTPKKKAATKKKTVARTKKTTTSKKKSTKATGARRTKSPRTPKVLNSPSFSGKPQKLARDTYPEDAAAKDFHCFGPAATTDGELESVRICDLGCFTQDGKDSNKYYHGAVVQHRKSKNWYTYLEWGRTGGSTCSFQFIACQSEEDGRCYFAKQLHTKNDKRGEWVTIAGIRTLQAKKGKDCYLVRPMATRTTGLPDARNVTVSQRTPVSKIDCADGSSTKKSGKASGKSRESLGCPKTLKLLRDIRLATIDYTRRSMADSSIPTQRAVDEARHILGEASARIALIDDDIEVQVNDKKLMNLTNLMFSRIPRKKRVKAAASTWVLSQDNIQNWTEDLDTFESALKAINMEVHPDADILGEMNLEMEWIEPDSRVGKLLHQWWPNASEHRHKKMKSMNIRNMWEVNRLESDGRIPKAQKQILKRKFEVKAKPTNQPRKRLDVPTKQRADYENSNTALLLHGTRSVNVNAILRESFRMPETLVAVTLTGAKFGPGIYFTDDWKKAADYSNAKGSAEAGRVGAVKGRKAFMFAADVVLGKSHVPEGVQGFAKPPRGHHSVFAKADYSGVVDNEFVVYKTDQSKLRYLIEFETT